MNVLPWVLLAYFLVLFWLGSYWAQWKERDEPQYKRGYLKPVKPKRKSR